MMRAIQKINLTRNKAIEILETILKEACPKYDSVKIKPCEFNLAELTEKKREEIIGQYIEACNIEIRNKTGHSISNPYEWDMPDEQGPGIPFNNGSDLVEYVLSEKETIRSHVRMKYCLV